MTVVVEGRESFAEGALGCARENCQKKVVLAWSGNRSGSATCCTVNPSPIVVSLPTMSSTSDILLYSKRPEWQNITPIPQHKSLGFYTDECTARSLDIKTPN